MSDFLATPKVENPPPELLEQAVEWCLRNPKTSRKEPLVVALRREFGLGLDAACEVARLANRRLTGGRSHG